MKRIQIFQGDKSIEMIRSGIFINCDLSGMGHVHALQVRSSNLLLEKRVNHFKHSNLRHGTCNLQPTKMWIVYVHCTAVWWFIIVSFTFTKWELMELGLSHREGERVVYSFVSCEDEHVLWFLVTWCVHADGVALYIWKHTCTTVLFNSIDPGLAFKHLNDSRFWQVYTRSPDLIYEYRDLERCVQAMQQGSLLFYRMRCWVANSHIM